MENTQKMPRIKGVKMYVADVFDWLDTAPFGAVIIYKIEVDDSLPLQPFYVAAFDDGNLEVVWGSGVTPEDALEASSKEWEYLYEDSPEREANPFREILNAKKEGE